MNRPYPLIEYNNSALKLSRDLADKITMIVGEISEEKRVTLEHMLEDEIEEITEQKFTQDDIDEAYICGYLEGKKDG